MKVLLGWQSFKWSVSSQSLCRFQNAYNVGIRVFHRFQFYCLIQRYQLFGSKKNAPTTGSRRDDERAHISKRSNNSLKEFAVVKGNLALFSSRYKHRTRRSNFHPFSPYTHTQFLFPPCIFGFTLNYIVCKSGIQKTTYL